MQFSTLVLCTAIVAAAPLVAQEKGIDTQRPISRRTLSGTGYIPIPDTLTCGAGWLPGRVTDMTITPSIPLVTKIIVAIWLLSFAASVAQIRISDQELASKANQYMANLAKLDYFSGAVLIARDGRVV